MTTKLTLKIEEKNIRKAKHYAKQHNTSLSKLVDVFFDHLTGPEGVPEDDKKYTPLVKELSGVIPPEEGKAQRKSYTDFLEEKYR